MRGQSRTISVPINATAPIGYKQEIHRELGRRLATGLRLAFRRRCSIVFAGDFATNFLLGGRASSPTRRLISGFVFRA